MTIHHGHVQGGEASSLADPPSQVVDLLEVVFTPPPAGTDADHLLRWSAMNDALVRDAAPAGPADSSEPVHPDSAPTRSGPDADLPLTVIEPRPGWHFINLREMWRSREVLYYLAWRDIKVRYKQTALGVTWAFAQPVFAMLVFTLFLGNVAGLGGEVEHYALFVFAGMLPWTFFASAVSQAGNSLIANERLITRVYFPRLLVPFSSVGSVFFDFMLALPLLAIMALWYGVSPTWNLLIAPLTVAMIAVTGMGVGAWISALVAVQRDFRYVMYFAVQIWMFATPAVYRPTSTMSETARWWVPLNPAHGLIENFRQSVLGGPINWYSLGISTAVGLVVAVIGIAYFRRMERVFADVI
jgi:lipopolysaccharide transport system permease protein